MTPLRHVHELLHIGDDLDAHKTLKSIRRVGEQQIRRVPHEGWAIVHAAKSPWWANAVGHEGHPLPGKLEDDHPHRWFKQDGDRMFLNLVDMPVQRADLVLPILNAGVEFIEQQIKNNRSILVHCNQGLARSPAVVLWWMRGAEVDFDYSLGELLRDHPYVKVDSGIVNLVRENWS